MPLRSDLAAGAMRPIAERLGTSIEAASEACIRVATSNMVARTLPYLAGHGVAARDLALVAYGGAGAIHGPLLAEEIGVNTVRSEEHTSELQSLMRISYAVFCLKKKNEQQQKYTQN